MLTALRRQDCCLCQVNLLQVLVLEVHEVQGPQLALLVVPPMSRGLRRLLDHGSNGLVTLLYQRLHTQTMTHEPQALLCSDVLPASTSTRYDTWTTNALVFRCNASAAAAGQGKLLTVQLLV